MLRCFTRKCGAVNPLPRGTLIWEMVTHGCVGPLTQMWHFVVTHHCVLSTFANVSLCGYTPLCVSTFANMSLCGYTLLCGSTYTNVSLCGYTPLCIVHIHKRVTLWLHSAVWVHIHKRVTLWFSLILNVSYIWQIKREEGFKSHGPELPAT